MRLTGLVFALSCVVTVGAQPKGSVCISDVKPISATSIVLPVSDGVLVTRRALEGGEDGSFIQQDCDVVASRVFNVGQRIRILMPWSRSDSREGLARSPHLVLAGVATETTFEVPSGTWLRWLSPQRYRTQDDQAVVVAAFKTVKTSLPPGNDFAIATTEALLDCFEGSSVADARGLAELLSAMKYPGATRVSLRDGAACSLLANYAKEIALRTEEPEIQARIYWTLNTWSVIGSVDDYYRSVMTLAADKDAFAGEDELPAPPFWDQRNRTSLPEGFTHALPDPDVWATTVANSQNPKVTRFLLDKLGGLAPSEEKDATLAPLLEDKDPAVRYLTAKHFAKVYKQADHSPKKIVGSEGGRITVTYEMLDECVAHWKAYWQKG